MSDANEAPAVPALSDNVKGQVDLVDGNRISGWAYDPDHPHARVEIGVHMGGNCLFTVTADRFRQDLLATGHSDGFHAFEIIVPAEVFVAPVMALQIRVGKGGRELAKSPVEVQTKRLFLNEAVLAVFGTAITVFTAAAETPQALDGLHQWLIGHQDAVYARRAELARLALHRELWFDGKQGQTTLADVMAEAAKGMAERYGALRLDEAAEPQVSVIIPAFNQFAYTYRCMQAMLAHKPQAAFEIILSDDGSTDETLYAALVLGGGIRVVRSGRNAGFVAAVTAGVQAARGRYLLLLNNDTEVQPGWLDELLGTFARDPKIGIAGSKLVYPDGRLQEAGGLVWRDGVAANYGHLDDPANPRYCYMRDADYVSGAALMVERALFDTVGGLSAEFAPGYYEDTDLCFKVRAAGRRVVVQPAAVVVHHEGVSAGTDAAGPMKRFQHVNHRKFLDKWAGALQASGASSGNARLEVERRGGKRLLWVDNTVPTPDEDAGSNAAIQFMLSLQRLGFQVAFAGTHNMARIAPHTPALERLGIECFYHPYTSAFEAVIADANAQFDVVFVHRLTNMEAYYAALRRRFPQAQIVYAMADIHHLRMERESALTQDRTLAKAAACLAAVERAMAAAADATVVHSSFEAGYLARTVPGARVHTVPWVVPAWRTPIAFAARRGIGFVGGYRHTPNVDAAAWLVGEVMPLVWADDPSVECLLIGSNMPPAVAALAGPRVKVLGHVPELRPVLDGLRLTVAPLRYGAGLKGKVLTSLAAGIPCVATSCAVEGMEWPGELDALVADTPQDFAARILLAYRDETLNDALGAAGLRHVEAFCAPHRVDALLGAALTRGRDETQGSAPRDTRRAVVGAVHG